MVLDFEGGQIFGLLHLPAGDVVGAPAVILGPGMDMIKEDYIYAAERYYTSRGIVPCPSKARARARPGRTG